MSKTTSVSLGSAVDIMQASGLKTRLATALAKELPVVFIADKVEKADTAGLQLLYAFKQQIEANGLTVTWQNISDALKHSSEILGMCKPLGLK